MGLCTDASTLAHQGALVFARAVLGICAPNVHGSFLWFCKCGLFYFSATTWLALSLLSSLEASSDGPSPRTLGHLPAMMHFFHRGFVAPDPRSVPFTQQGHWNVPANGSSGSQGEFVNQSSLHVLDPQGASARSSRSERRGDMTHGCRALGVASSTLVPSLCLVFCGERDIASLSDRASLPPRRSLALSPSTHRVTVVLLISEHHVSRCFCPGTHLSSGIPGPGGL